MGSGVEGECVCAGEVSECGGEGKLEGRRGEQSSVMCIAKGREAYWGEECGFSSIPEFCLLRVLTCLRWSVACLAKRSVTFT